MVQRVLGFSGRSEVFRAGARLLIQDAKAAQELEGEQGGVLIVLHGKGSESDITVAKHEYEDIVDTQLHNHSLEGKCLDIFILKGNAMRLRDMARHVTACGEVDYVKLITPY
jgi:CopG family nickel-responsive transcriptional regulator